MTHDPADLVRRGLLTGVAAAGALGATPALAQFPNLGASVGGQFGQVGDLVGQAANVIAGMNLTEADEIAMGGAYYDRFIDQSGGLYNSQADQAALRKFAEPLIGTSKRRALSWEIALLDNETVN